jgi:hypothetical protein
MYKVIHLNSDINQVIEENLIDVMGTCDIKKHNYLDSKYPPRWAITKHFPVCN